LHQHTSYICFLTEIKVILIFKDNFQFLSIGCFCVYKTITFEWMTNLCLKELLKILVINIVYFTLFPTSLHFFIELIAFSSTTTRVTHTIGVKRRHQLLLTIKEQIIFIQIIIFH
jgi:hypothetical protein